MQISMFSSEEHPASHSASPDSERDWLIRVATSCLPILRLLTDIGPSGWFGRTSPASCHLTEGGILEPCSEGWQNSGMGSPTEFLTLSTSEWPSDAAVCSLSQILETGDVPQRFYLSPRACAGILRRAAKRGKELPPALRAALTQVATRPGGDASEDCTGRGIPLTVGALTDGAHNGGGSTVRTPTQDELSRCLNAGGMRRQDWETETLVVAHE